MYKFLPYTEVFENYVQRLVSTQKEGLNRYQDVNDVIFEDFSLYIENHNLVNVFEDGKQKQKICAFCKANKLTTSSGRVILTRHKCDMCNVPLCKGRDSVRPCFYLYHSALFYGIDHTVALDLYMKTVNTYSH